MRIRTKGKATRHKGIALITVMMVVAMVSATASWLILQQHVALQRITNVLHEEQAFLLALGIESYVRRLLTSDGQSDSKNQVDYYARYDDESRNEWWSKQGTLDEERVSQLLGFESVRSSKLTWCVFDLSAFHNVNNFRFLAVAQSAKDKKPKPKSVREKSEAQQAAAQKKDEQPTETPKPEDEDDKRRSLSAAAWEKKMFDSLYGGSPERWAALMDWFDKDKDARNQGGEDPYYLNLEPPYRVSGMRLVWPEELGIIKGFNGYTPGQEVVALPSVKPVKINVNTASREMLGKILNLMQINLDGEEWGQLLYQRRYSPFRNMDSFYSRLVSYHDERVTQASLRWANNFLSVNSNYFMALVQIQLGSASISLQSVLVREPKEPHEVYVLQRRLGKAQYTRRDCRVDSPIIVKEEQLKEREGNNVASR